MLAVQFLRAAASSGTLNESTRVGAVLEARAALPPVLGWGTHVHPLEGSALPALVAARPTTAADLATEANDFHPPEGFDRVFKFLGYGDPGAPVWFLGMEEGARTETLSLDENIQRRAESFVEVMDLEMAHSSQLLNAPLSTPSPTWQWMAKIMLGLKGRDLEDTAEANVYVATRLGRSGQETLLAELLPLPSPDASAWPVEYHRWFRTRPAYRDRVVPWRLRLLARRVAELRPRLVIAYGSTNWLSYRRLFTDVEFRRAPEVDDRFLVGRSGETVVVLSSFLGNGWMSHAAIESLVQYVRRAGIRVADDN